MRLDKKINLQKNTVNDPVHVLYFILSNCNMLAFAKKLTRCSELAQDLFQDTVERILKYAEKFEHRGDGHTKSWATSIMYTIFVNNYRKKKLNSTRENQFYIESEGWMGRKSGIKGVKWTTFVSWPGGAKYQVSFYGK